MYSASGVLVRTTMIGTAARLDIDGFTCPEPREAPAVTCQPIDLPLSEAQDAHGPSGTISGFHAQAIAWSEPASCGINLSCEF